MRKVILLAGITLDGYLARPDDSIDYLVMTKEGQKAFADFFASIDVILMGRKTFDAAVRMVGHCPTHDGISSYVFSRTLAPGKRDGLTFVNQTPAAWLRKIRTQPGKHIFHMGGGELARAFLKADLIDELFLGVVPILLGDGLPLFPPGFPQRDFTLVENKTYSKSQIGLTYRRARSKGKRK